jgi:tetratricopeptide (TPR) repeat protein
LDYYATINSCLVDQSMPAARHIRNAVLLNVHDDSARVAALKARFTMRERFFRDEFKLPLDIGGTSRPDYFWTAHLTAGPAPQVLEAAAEAHWLTHQIVHERSGSVGAIMKRVAAEKFEEDHNALQRAKALYTFAFASSLTMPWIFASDEDEREQIVSTDLGGARDAVVPTGPLWVARQVTLITLYRRAGVWALLGEPARAYNDYWKTQQIVRLTKAGARYLNAEAQSSLNVLDALAEYQIGELYRADHDYRQALVHCCRSHDRLVMLPGEEARMREGGSVASLLANSHWRVSLLLNKGKAFYEQGQMKRACKWFLRAWQALDDIVTASDRVVEMRYPSILTAEDSETITAVTDWLTQIRNDPDFVKERLVDRLKPVVASFDRRYVPPHLTAVAADILNRLGHTLMVMRLPDDDDLALRCLRLAFQLDPSNLLVRSDLLQLRSRGRDTATTGLVPDVLDCWPSGGTVVDQVIRVAEHHTRRRMNRGDSRDAEIGAQAPEGGEQRVARALLRDFLTHTDSIHVRSGLFYQHLAPRRGQVLAPPRPAIEFVCLRRYGSSSPFLARPASVPAIGGGYLVRLLHDNAQYNILIDPGDGVVANLYRVGFAVTDVDMIIVTHDHPDHLAGLDPILALLREASKLLPASREPAIYGNASVVARYGAVEFGPGRRIQPLPEIGKTFPLRLDEIGEAVITALPTRHKDLGGNDAVGLHLAFSDVSGTAVGTLTFMSDASRTVLEDDVMVDALDGDVVVAHISNASVGELSMLTFPESLDDQQSMAFAAEMATLEQSKSGFAQAEYKKLAHALELSGPSESQHLLLRGVLAVAQQMSSGRVTARGNGRVLVVGEFREQLGPFRGKIAHHVTDHVLRDAGHVALTADIGLRLRIDADGVQAQCSRCTLNNDRLPLEQYHDPTEIREVCIKGDFEGMKWNCARHDPGGPKGSSSSRFAERSSGYDAFGPGGMFHG